MTLPDWWGRNASRPTPKKRTPMRKLPRIKKVKTPRKPLPANAVKTPGGVSVNRPITGLYPTKPAAAKFATAPRKPEVAR